MLAGTLLQDHRWHSCFSSPCFPVGVPQTPPNVAPYIRYWVEMPILEPLLLPTAAQFVSPAQAGGRADGRTGGLAGWALNGGMSQAARTPRSCPALRREHHHANERL